MSPSVAVIFAATGSDLSLDFLSSIFPCAQLRGRTVIVDEIEVDVADISDWIPIEYEGVGENFGWKHSRLISLSANCRSKRSCFLLGCASVEIARHVNGLICLGDMLGHWTSDKSILTREGVFEFGGGHYLNADAMSSWIVHPDFNLF